MKKLLFVFVACMAMTFASCGGAVTPASDNDSIDTITVDTVSADTICIDSTICE